VIPNRLHFIFGLEKDLGGKPFSFIHYLAIRSAAVVNQPDEIVLHYTHHPDGLWWEAIQRYVTLNRVYRPEKIFGRPVSHYAHKADILRLELLRDEGGIYLDIDTFCIRSFKPLRKHKAVMGIEKHGLCNAVILAEQGSAFISLWMNAYRDFDDSIWNYHSVQLPYKLALRNPEIIHIEGAYSFFFPMFDDPMHLWLWRNDLRLNHRITSIRTILKNFNYYSTLIASGDWPMRVYSYYLRHTLATRKWYYKKLKKAYCTHLWESIWWEPYLKEFGPATVQRSDGLFARLIREVIPDVEEL
jgi:hypothetical protein